MTIQIGFGIEIDVSDQEYQLYFDSNGSRKSVGLHRAKKMLAILRDEAQEQVNAGRACAEETMPPDMQQSINDARNRLARFEETGADLEFLHLLNDFEIDRFKQCALIRLYFTRNGSTNIPLQLEARPAYVPQSFLSARNELIPALRLASRQDA